MYSLIIQKNHLWISGLMTYRNFNVLMLPREDGIAPLSAFFCSSNISRFVRLPKDSGIDPVSLFLHNLLKERRTLAHFSVQKNSQNLRRSFFLQHMNIFLGKPHVQVSQCADGAKCSRYGSSEMVTIKIQDDKIRQIAQRFRYRPCQLVLIQPPEGEKDIGTFISSEK